MSAVRLVSAVSAVLVAAVLVAPGAAHAAEPPRPHERTLNWTCTDGTSFTAARPDSNANASPVLGSTQVWLQVERTITRADGSQEVTTFGGGRLTSLAGPLLDCSTTSGENHVRVLGLLVG